MTVSGVLVYTTNVRGAARGMAIQPDHFVERHGLIILIVVGESIVAIGIGAAGAPVDLPLAAGAALGIALSAAIWWVYFDGDEERATEALTASLGSGRIIDRVIGAIAAVPAGLLAVIAGWAGLAAVTVVLAVIGALDHLVAERHTNAAQA